MLDKFNKFISFCQHIFYFFMKLVFCLALNSFIKTNAAPRKKEMAGPIEKSKQCENKIPAIAAPKPTIQLIINRFLQFAEKNADIVAGIIRKAKITTTPPMRTDTVITIPNNA